MQERGSWAALRSLCGSSPAALVPRVEMGASLPDFRLLGPRAVWEERMGHARCLCGVYYDEQPLTGSVRAEGDAGALMSIVSLADQRVPRGPHASDALVAIQTDVRRAAGLWRGDLRCMLSRVTGQSSSCPSPLG